VLSRRGQRKALCTLATTVAATVAEFGNYRQIWRQSPFSATIAVFGDCRRIAPFSATVAKFGDKLSPFPTIVAEIGDYSRQCGQGLKLRVVLGGLHRCHQYHVDQGQGKTKIKVEDQDLISYTKTKQ